MKWFRKRPTPPPKEEPFWQGTDGQAMEQCWRAVRIAAMKVMN